VTFPAGLRLVLVRFLDRIYDDDPERYAEAYRFMVQWLRDKPYHDPSPWDHREAYRLVQEAWAAFVVSDECPI
jgi:hypothetical protein